MDDKLSAVSGEQGFTASGETARIGEVVINARSRRMAFGRKRQSRSATKQRKCCFFCVCGPVAQR